MLDITKFQSKESLIDIANKNKDLLRVLQAINVKNTIRNIYASEYVCGMDQSGRECVDLRIMLIADNLDWDTLKDIVKAELPEYSIEADYSQFGFDIVPETEENMHIYDGFIKITDGVNYGRV